MLELDPTTKEPKNNKSLGYWAARWRWNRTRVLRFFIKLSKGSSGIKPLITMSDKDGVRMKDEEFWYGIIHKEEDHSKEFADNVVDIFNSVMKRKVTANESKTDLIRHRFNEANKIHREIGLENIRKMFLYMKGQWGGNEDMEKHLEIETLFTKKNFFKYLDQSEKPINNGSVLKEPFIKERVHYE